MDIQRKIKPKILPKSLERPTIPSEEAFFVFTEEERKRTNFLESPQPRILAEEFVRQEDFLPYELPRTVESKRPTPQKSISFDFLKKYYRQYIFRGAGIFFAFVFLAGGYIFAMKNAIETEARAGVEAALVGGELLEKEDWVGARQSFENAQKHFKTARKHTLYFPVPVARGLSSVPLLSRGMAGVLALDAGEHLAEAGLTSVGIIEPFVSSKEAFEKGESVSFLSLFEDVKDEVKVVENHLQDASKSLLAINIQSVPEEDRLTVELLKTGVPGLTGAFSTFNETRPLFNELLGKNGPRTYLFLFQNNQELRPTGGFIGTYGILEFKDGHARRFFIDGIFNPDGQLRENIVPPKPIQKISAGWSLHDSNWFPHFPLSAEKAIFFYEKTGGPTVDGVFTLTPSVMERLLALTGPIALPGYDLVVDENNFIPTIQEQVEVKYDKVENKPKKVLSDLASILMERVFATTDPVTLYKMANIFVDGLNERHILLYTRNPEAAELIKKAGWSGEQVASPHDYLSVVNTNINGYKTDGIIEDKIQHKATIESDGSVIVTTTITRIHKGGNTPYDWWNRVNSNYMRVYVPQGSKLIHAEGHTPEFPKEPLDYDALGFKRDPDVVKEEAKIIIDEATGTRVGEEAGKTVFGNWVYVSPGESVSVTYTYLLPFRVDPKKEGSAAYSFLFQKQPGVIEVELESKVETPADWKSIWQTGTFLLPLQQQGIEIKEKVSKDLFYGLIFE